MLSPNLAYLCRKRNETSTDEQKIWYISICGLVSARQKIQSSGILSHVITVFCEFRYFINTRIRELFDFAIMYMFASLLGVVGMSLGASSFASVKMSKIASILY